MSISVSTPTATPILPLSVPPPPPARLLKPAHLQSLSTHFHTELDLLDRIVYKNQSQFRLNIFWRKVIEIRRIGRKVRESWEEIRGKGILETAGEETKANRGSLKRFAVLIEKLHLALPKLHNALTLTIELTHFLPTVVVLLGITSRLWATSFILYDHLVCLWDISFVRGTNGKHKGLRKLPEWNHAGSGSVHKNTAGSTSTSVGATERDIRSTIPVSLLSTTTTTDLPADSSHQSELGQVIERVRSKPDLPFAHPSGSVVFDNNSEYRSEAEAEDDIGIKAEGVSEMGEKISRDYFSLPLRSGYHSSTPSDQSAVIDSHSSPSTPPVINKPADRRKVLKNDSSAPLVSSPLSRLTSFSPPIPAPAPALPSALPLSSSSSSLQGLSDPNSSSSSSTKLMNAKSTKRSKTSDGPIGSTSKIKPQAQDSLSASSIPSSPKTSTTSTKPVKSVAKTVIPPAVDTTTTVARTIPTKRKNDIPADNPLDTLGGKEVKKKKKKKKGDEIDDIFG